MICTICGKEFEGNFCPICGTRANTNDSNAQCIPSLNAPLYMEIGGIEVDINLVIRVYGLGARRIGAYTYISQMTGVPVSAARSIVSPIINHHIQNGESAGIIRGVKAQAELSSWTKAPSINDAPTQKSPTKHQRIKENKRNAVACCPKCGSTSLSANKKGFGIGKGVIGAAITAPLAAPLAPFGLVAGNIGARKVWVTCLNCGKRWKL